MGLRIRIEFKDPLHHGSGFGAAGMIDRTLVRDASAMPYLAGSAIKGKLRYATALLMPAEGGNPCRSPGTWCRGEPFCGICILFGSPVRQGTAEFHDAYPTEEFRARMQVLIDQAASPFLAGATEVRASTSISRRWRRGESRHLYSTESAPAGIVFEGEIGGRLDPRHVELLQKAAAMITHFGADGARGLGACTLRLDEVEEKAG